MGEQYELLPDGSVAFRSFGRPRKKVTKKPPPSYRIVPTDIDTLAARPTVATKRRERRGLKLVLLRWTPSEPFK